MSLRNTSTDVEKTEQTQAPVHPLWKHLHGRGEDRHRRKVESRSSETPPRTWRRQRARGSESNIIRNTSTDMEKTFPRKINQLLFQKHLHGRGEDHQNLGQLDHVPETPPRTWRRLGRFALPALDSGNTSTDVEKTVSVRIAPFRLRKHLHGRGEDEQERQLARRKKETPPRTWRRPSRCLQSKQSAGKHLHGRGEDRFSKKDKQRVNETPPRTWRRPPASCRESKGRRNTSTDVEKTDEFRREWVWR